MSKALLIGFFALALAGLATGCKPEVPANPTYTNDVGAILDAHCSRCHGANEMLHSMVVAGVDKPPRFCYLQRYDDVGDCSTITNAGCMPGAGNTYCAGMIVTYVTLPDDASLRMPPAPSEPLNDWEIDVLKRWSASGAPK